VAGNSFVGTPMWCSHGSADLEPEWNLVSMDISSLSGTISQLGFQFVSDGDSNGGAGVWVDNVQIIWGKFSIF
jgi:hypothetical protein